MNLTLLLTGSRGNAAGSNSQLFECSADARLVGAPVPRVDQATVQKEVHEVGREAEPVALLSSIEFASSVAAGPALLHPPAMPPAISAFHPSRNLFAAPALERRVRGSLDRQTEERSRAPECLRTIHFGHLPRAARSG